LNFCLFFVNHTKDIKTKVKSSLMFLRFFFSFKFFTGDLQGWPYLLKTTSEIAVNVT